MVDPTQFNAFNSSHNPRNSWGSQAKSDPLAYFFDSLETLKQSGLYEEALEKVQSMLIGSPTHPRLLENLADIYICQQQFQEAIDVLNFLESQKDLTSSGLYLAGFAHLSLSRFEKWVQYLEKSNTASANNPEVLRNMWWAYNMMGDHQLGITILKRALVLKPEDAYILEDLSMAYLNAGDEKMAAEILAQLP